MMIEKFKFPLKIFYAYEEEDEWLLQELEVHLSPLSSQGYVKSWHRRQIQAGREVASEIDTHLKDADIIILLISARFMASHYDHEYEVVQALERHQAGEVYVIPIILRPADWIESPLGGLQALPKNRKPVVTWGGKVGRDKAFQEIVQSLRHMIKDHKIEDNLN